MIKITDINPYGNHICKEMKFVTEFDTSINMDNKNRWTVSQHNFDYEYPKIVKCINYCPFCGVKLP